MTRGDHNAELVPIALGTVRPYVSVVVLEPRNAEIAGAFDEVRGFLRMPTSSRTRAEVALFAEGFDVDVTMTGSIRDTVGLVHRISSSPSWQVGQGPIRDLRHVLTLIARSDELIAVLVDRMWSDPLQSWLDRPGRGVRRVPDDRLQRAFLRGEAKGLWLRGAHASRTTKADSKSLVGQRLQDALQPHADGTYALVAGRARLLPDPTRTAITGAVGTTPGRGLVWCRQADSVADYLQVLDEIFREVGLAAGVDDEVLGLLAGRVDDLAAVRGAFEIGFGSADEVPTADLDVDDLRAAAELLDRTELRIHGEADRPDFRLDVVADERTLGSLVGRIVPDGRRRRLELEIAPGAVESATVELVLEAARRHEDLLTVRYRSGHAYMRGDVICSAIRRAHFPGWDFRSFIGFRVDREKPRGDVHADVGRAGDDSLFGWVVRAWCRGHLTCDDGPGEIADFVHVDVDGTLSLIHVKKARSRVAGRGIAAAAYEVVVGQAVKNLPFVDDPGLLARRLDRPAAARFATWSDGRRVDDRTRLLAALRDRDATAEVRVVVVQPHVQDTVYRGVVAAGRTGVVGDELLRLYLLESLLNAAAADIAGRGGTLCVIGELVER